MIPKQLTRQHSCTMRFTPVLASKIIRQWRHHQSVEIVKKGRHDKERATLPNTAQLQTTDCSDSRGVIHYDVRPKLASTRRQTVSEPSTTGDCGGLETSRGRVRKS